MGVPQVDPNNYGMGALQNIQIAKQNDLLNLAAQKKMEEYDADAPMRQNAAVAEDLQTGLETVYKLGLTGNVNAIKSFASQWARGPNAQVAQEIVENVDQDLPGMMQALSQAFGGEGQSAATREFRDMTQDFTP